MSEGTYVNELNNSITTGIDPANEFNYKPVPPMAPVSLVIGLFSAIALLSYIGVAIGIVGIIVGSI